MVSGTLFALRLKLEKGFVSYSPISCNIIQSIVLCRHWVVSHVNLESSMLLAGTVNLALDGQPRRGNLSSYCFRFPFSGIMRPGLNAIMGPTGCGKSS